MTPNQTARSRITIEELIADNKLMAQMFDEIGKSIEDLSDLRGFALVVAASCNEKGKEFLKALSEAIKMVDHPKLGDLLVPKRLPLDGK